MHVVYWSSLIDFACVAEGRDLAASNLQAKGCRYHRRHHRPNCFDH